MKRRLILSLWLIVFPSVVSGMEYFVATDGKDDNPGTQDFPFATLIRARDEIREKNAAGELKTPVSVYVRGGKYFLGETFRLSEQDSGTSDALITYGAYPGEKPILSGGSRLTGWKPYQGKIYQSELSQSEKGRWKFRQLFVNGKRQIRARYPNYDATNALYGGWLKITESLPGGENGKAFRYSPESCFAFWEKPSQGEMNVILGCCGYHCIIPIASRDEETRTITLTRAPINPPEVGLKPESISEPVQSAWDFKLFGEYCGTLDTTIKWCTKTRYFVENLLEELDTPGEWCLDSESGIVYYWPEESIEKLDIVAPRLDCLIDMDRVSYVKLSGLMFTETADGDNYLRTGGDGYGAMYPQEGLNYCGEAVHLNDCQYCTVEKNVFESVGGNGIYLEGYNLRNEIFQNEIRYPGNCAVVLLGSEAEHPLYNRVANNHIHHTGVYGKYCPAVFLGMSNGNFIEHNQIEYVPHHAVNLSNNCLGRNYVEYNRIRFACQETSDNGAINSWMEGGHDGMVRRDIERAGHIIRYNFITDVPGRGAIDAGTSTLSFGIYLDNYSSNCVVYGNIVARISHAGILVHSGKNNLIENNILADNGSQMRFQEFWHPLGLGFMEHNCFRRNILYFSTPQKVFDLKLWNEKTVSQSDYNILWNHRGSEYEFAWGHKDKTVSPIESFEGWRALGYDTHSVICDPMFTAPDQDDYHLKPESPAWKLGFQPIPYEQIGIQAPCPFCSEGH